MHILPQEGWSTFQVPSGWHSNIDGPDSVSPVPQVNTADVDIPSVTVLTVPFKCSDKSTHLSVIQVIYDVNHDFFMYKMECQMSNVKLNIYKLYSYNGVNILVNSGVSYYQQIRQ